MRESTKQEGSLVSIVELLEFLMYSHGNFDITKLVDTSTYQFCYRRIRKITSTWCVNIFCRHLMVRDTYTVF